MSELPQSASDGKSITTSKGSSAIRGHALLTGLWLLVALPFLTNVSCDVLVGIALSGAWLALAVAWLIVASRPPGLLRSGTGMLWWAFAGGAGCLGLVLGMTNVGLSARIALCESSLSAYASEIGAGGGDLRHEPQRVGLFWVDGEETYGGAVLLYTSQAFLNREGIAYLPPGTTEPTQVPRRLQHLYGPWYTCVWKF